MDKILTITEEDYLSMEAFPLKWRFTSPTHGGFTDELLSRVKPLRNTVAEKLCRLTDHFFVPYHLNEKEFLSVECFDCPLEEANTHIWLADRIPEHTNKLIVLWDESDAVLTDKELFCKYWDDFCYPASDDNVIFPITMEWVLYYWHEEQFQFGRRR